MEKRCPNACAKVCMLYHLLSSSPGMHAMLVIRTRPAGFGSLGDAFAHPLLRGRLHAALQTKTTMNVLLLPYKPTYTTRKRSTSIH